MDNALTFTVSEARSQLSDVVSRVAYSHTAAVITKNGKKAVAVVPYEVLELLSRLEALIDINKAREALDDFESKGGITLEDLKKMLEIE